MSIPTSGLQNSRISLISKSEIRYEGTLHSINPEENTVALRNVRMLGTENRKEVNPIPPHDQIFEFIIFKGSDIKDLTVFDSQPALSAVDPAVINVWSSNTPNVASNPPSAQGWGGPIPQQHQPQQQQQQQQRWDNRQQNQPQRQQQGRQDRPPNNNYNRQQPQRNQGQDRQYQQRHYNDRGGERDNNQGGYRPYSSHNNSQHTGQDFQPRGNGGEIGNDFDFQEAIKREPGRPDVEAEAKYDSAKSFFDEISCSALDGSAANAADKARIDRRQQKQRDLETFGETSLREGIGYGYGGRRGYGGRGGRNGGGRRGGNRGGW